MYRIFVYLSLIGLSHHYQFKDEPLGSGNHISGGGSGGFGNGFGGGGSFGNGLGGGGAFGNGLGGAGAFGNGLGGAGAFGNGLGGGVIQSGSGATGCNRNRNNRRKPNLDTIVTQIARAIIDVDNKIQSFCNSHADHYLRETYGSEYYKLTITVDDFDEDSISVKVIHKLVFISAQDCLSTYADLRLLPDVVDTANGVWKYSLGELSIYFPYIIRPEVQVEKNCGGPINPQVIIVPKCGQNTVFDTDYPIKFGDVSFRNSYKDFFSHISKK